MRQTHTLYKQSYDMLIGDFPSSNMVYDVSLNMDNSQKMLRQVYSDSEILSV